MPDPNDPSFTYVRHMNTLKLTDWKAAFQPLASGVMESGVPIILMSLRLGWGGWFISLRS